MKKATPVALIAAGKLTDSPLARLEGLRERLGPVKSPSFRLSSRTANSLRAGHPVKDFAEFEACGLILLSVPEETIAGVVAELCATDISWPGKAVVLCSSWLDSGVLAELNSRGAATGSINPIPGFDDLWYLGEGDKLAVREARELVEHHGRRVVAIKREFKPLYLAALTCTSSLLVAVLRTASGALRLADVSSSRSASIVERQVNRTLRSYLKAGRKAYTPPRDLPRQLKALAEADPALARYLEESSELASRLMESR